jgi:hypothetical protein
MSKEIFPTEFFPKRYAPTDQEIANVNKLITTILQPMTDALECTIQITCGKRTPTANESVGGVMGSQHLNASAVDFVMDSHNVSLFNVFKFMFDNKYPFRQAIYSRKKNFIGAVIYWIHVAIQDNEHPIKNEALLEDNLGAAVKYTVYSGGALPEGWA